MIVGGVGAGLYGMLLLAVFIAGLMVGRSPEYVGKKMEVREVKLAVLAIAVLQLIILGGTANNGSAFAGLGAGAPFYNGLLGVAMWVGRFFVIIPVLAIAGSLAAKRQMPAGPGSFPTTGPL